MLEKLASGFIRAAEASLGSPLATKARDVAQHVESTYDLSSIADSSDIDFDLGVATMVVPAWVVLNLLTTPRILTTDVDKGILPQEYSCGGGVSCVPLVHAPVSTTARSVRVVVSDRQGSHVGVVLSGDMLLANPSEEAAIVVAVYLSSLMHTTAFISASRLDLYAVLNSQYAFLVIRQTERELGLLAAADLGFLPAEELGSRVQLALGAISSPVVVNSAHAYRSRIFRRAHAAHDAFGLFLGLYQVMEHCFFESYLRDLSTWLASGNTRRLANLLENRAKEKKMLADVLQPLLARVMPPSGASYPAAGHDIYVDCELPGGFSVTPANYRESLPTLIYAVRCGIVHTKAEHPYLEPKASILSVLNTALLLDMRWLARQLAA